MLILGFDSKKKYMTQGAKIIGTGLATTGLIWAGVGIGVEYDILILIIIVVILSSYKSLTS